MYVKNIWLMYGTHRLNIEIKLKKSIVFEKLIGIHEKTG